MVHLTVSVTAVAVFLSAASSALALPASSPTLSSRDCKPCPEGKACPKICLPSDGTCDFDCSSGNVCTIVCPQQCKPCPEGKLCPKICLPDECDWDCPPGSNTCSMSCPSETEKRATATDKPSEPAPTPTCRACTTHGCMPLMCPDVAELEPIMGKRAVGADDGCHWDCGPPCPRGQLCPDTCVWRCDMKKRAVEERAAEPEPCPVCPPGKHCPAIACAEPN